MLRIASELDIALKKVSDDAHEFLVHVEEREESERMLRQSLYVQTCEIMGQLLNELRRMLLPSISTNSSSNTYTNTGTTNSNDGDGNGSAIMSDDGNNDNTGNNNSKSRDEEDATKN